VKTHCKRNHRYSIENTYISSKGYPVCRTCERLRFGKKRAQERASRARVTCPECEGSRWISARQARRITSGEVEGFCPTCRKYGRRAAPPKESFYEWWLSRFSPAEIAVLASGLLETAPEHRLEVRDRLPKWRIADAFAGRRTAEERMEVAA
jgi:hypothetical protein